MSAFIWVCVFLLVGMLNKPCEGSEDEILRLSGELQHCLQAKDVACLVSHYHDDVIVAPDGHAAYSGVKHVEQNLQWVHHVDVTSGPPVQIEALTPDGDVMLEVHPFSAGGKHGKTALIWKRFHGEYKIIFEMFNDS